MNATFRQPWAALLVAGIASSVSPALAQPVSPDVAEHLIVAPSSLAAAFEPLAWHRTRAGTPSALVTLEHALASAPAGRDDAETLRNYLVQLFSLGNLRYVLLGGDSDQMPVRYVPNNFYPNPGEPTVLATDLYYAGLDGNWDADDDGVFGEPFLSGADPGDDADLDPDLAVGRAPVASVVQVQRFVDGVVAYDTSESAPHFGSALLLAEVLFPADWTGGTVTLDGALFAEDARADLLSHPSPANSLRFYENHTAYPGAMPLTMSAVAAALGSGSHGTVFLVGHGSADTIALGDVLLELPHIDALSNAPNFNVLVSLTSSAAEFPLDCVLERLVTAPNGGSAATLGFSQVVFPNTASGYTEAFFQELVARSAVPLGDAVSSALQTHAPNTFFNTSARWTSLTLTLLGDPGMPFRSEAEPVPAKPMSFSDLKATFGRN